MKEPKKYYAFISYKREDKRYAVWLQHKLEYYKLPVWIRKRNIDLPEKIRPIFRDVTDLSGGVLEKAIQDGLENSRYLIVICSPSAANSVWVGKEVQAFIDAKINDYHGRAHKGLGYSTPAARFHGQEKEIIDIYNATDQAYYESHPLRFKNQPSRAAKYAIAGPQYLNPTEEMKAKMLAEEAPS